MFMLRNTEYVVYPVSWNFLESGAFGIIRFVAERDPNIREGFKNGCTMSYDFCLPEGFESERYTIVTVDVTKMPDHIRVREKTIPDFLERAYAWAEENLKEKDGP